MVFLFYLVLTSLWKTMVHLSPVFYQRFFTLCDKNFASSLSALQSLDSTSLRFCCSISDSPVDSSRPSKSTSMDSHHFICASSLPKLYLARVFNLSLKKSSFCSKQIMGFLFFCTHSAHDFDISYSNSGLLNQNNSNLNNRGPLGLHVPYMVNNRGSKSKYCIAFSVCIPKLSILDAFTNK